MYKVFLVEDEIVAREGIRNTVDWQAVGFEFCGEAADGEMALPLIEDAKPDVLITDIKMPFMDGLQLSRIVREHMPWIKIVIISGHDEFEYARTALKIGVTEYLLKPISSSDIVDVLKRLAVSLAKEEDERERLKQLKSQVEYNLLLRREQLLLRLVMGGIPSGEAIVQAQRLGLSLVAQAYLVLLLKIVPSDAKSYDYNAHQRIEGRLSSLAGGNENILLTKRDLDGLVLLLKGRDAEQLWQEGQFWTELIQREIADETACRLIVEMGSPQERPSDIHRSFAEALAKITERTRKTSGDGIGGGETQIDLQKLDHEALENYLKFGDLDAFDAFFAGSLAPISESALRSDLVMHYLLLEVFMTISQFVSDLGNGADLGAPGIQEIEEISRRVTTIGQIRTELKQMISSALVFRNSRANYQRTMVIHRARAYVDEHYCDADLQMSRVAKEFGLSPSHFSTLFSQHIGETFRDYLNNRRINHAKELLRTTGLACAQVAYQSGYGDAHYFSTAFKRKAGCTPREFRSRSHTDKS